MPPPRLSLPPAVQSEITQPGLFLAGSSQDQGDQQLYSGGGHHQVRGHALAPTLSLPRRKSLVSVPLPPGRSPRLLTLSPPYSRVSSSVASYWVTSLPKGQRPMPPLPRGSPGSSDQSVPDARRLQCVFYNRWFVWASLGTGSSVRTMRTVQSLQRHAWNRVRGFTSCHRPAADKPSCRSLSSSHSSLSFLFFFLITLAA